MREQSPYEGSMDGLNGQMCLGRIWSVDPSARTVRVRTIGNKANGTDDQDLQNVKIAHFTWHGEGDYMTYVPRVGAYAIIAFINTEPVVLGYYPISNTFGGGGRDNQDALDPGDFGIATVAGNRIIVRSGGTVEIESTKGCRTYWLPNFDTISTVCQNLEVEPAGGRMKWTVDPKTKATVLTFVGWDAVKAPTTAMKLEIGSTSVEGKTVAMSVGPVDANKDVTAPNMSIQVGADGQITINVAGKATVDISPSGVISTVAETAHKTKAPKIAIGSGPIELLAKLSALIDAIGQLQIPTNLGPTGPVKTAPLWTEVEKINTDIKSITGEL